MGAGRPRGWPSARRRPVQDAAAVPRPARVGRDGQVGSSDRAAWLAVPKTMSERGSLSPLRPLRGRRRGHRVGGDRVWCQY